MQIQLRVYILCDAGSRFEQAEAFLVLHKGLKIFQRGGRGWSRKGKIHAKDYAQLLTTVLLSMCCVASDARHMLHPIEPDYFLCCNCTFATLKKAIQKP